MHAQVTPDINEKEKPKEDVENGTVTSTNIKVVTDTNNGSSDSEIMLLSKQSKEM